MAGWCVRTVESAVNQYAHSVRPAFLEVNDVAARCATHCQCCKAWVPWVRLQFDHDNVDRLTHYCARAAILVGRSYFHGIITSARIDVPHRGAIETSNR